ncbi:hypothetical protein C0J52_24843 [Blattella germanica]|nr:hypothetical protein C0J52_24843 [Blattella germanica]
MVVVMLSLAVTIGIAYLGFMEIYGLLQNSPENSPVSRYLSRHSKKQDTQVVPRKNNSNARLQEFYSQNED